MVVDALSYTSADCETYNDKHAPIALESSQVADGGGLTFALTLTWPFIVCCAFSLCC